MKKVFCTLRYSYHQYTNSVLYFPPILPIMPRNWQRLHLLANLQPQPQYLYHLHGLFSVIIHKLSVPLNQPNLASIDEHCLAQLYYDNLLFCMEMGRYLVIVSEENFQFAAAQFHLTNCFEHKESNHKSSWLELRIDWKFD